MVLSKVAKAVHSRAAKADLSRAIRVVRRAEASQVNQGLKAEASQAANRAADRPVRMKSALAARAEAGLNPCHNYMQTEDEITSSSVCF